MALEKVSFYIFLLNVLYWHQEGTILLERKVIPLKMNLISCHFLAGMYMSL